MGIYKSSCVLGEGKCPDLQELSDSGSKLYVTSENAEQYCGSLVRLEAYVDVCYTCYFNHYSFPVVDLKTTYSILLCQ